MFMSDHWTFYYERTSIDLYQRRARNSARTYTTLVPRPAILLKIRTKYRICANPQQRTAPKVFHRIIYYLINAVLALR